MNQKAQDYTLITNFLTSFTILEHSEESTVISSQHSTYLVRNMQIQEAPEKQKNQQLNQIINTLSQHQTFTSKNILSLIDFQIIYNNSKKQSQIRAVYEYGQKNLAKQIEVRKQTENYFEEDALWGLLYSITTSLAYLEQRNIIYGVIDPSRVFLDKNIAILDPSSTGINPYQIIDSQLYSPELLKEQRNIDQIDMFKSDVFVLGLLMLQSGLLKQQVYQYDQNIIRMSLSQMQDIYSQNFCYLIASMVKLQATERPNFGQILDVISDMFQISNSQVQCLQSCFPDKQDGCNEICERTKDQRENIDILQTEYVRYEQPTTGYSSRYKKSRQIHNYRLQNSNLNLNESSINEVCEQELQSSQFCLQESLVKSSQKSKRTYKSRQIKEKLIKHEYQCQTDRNQSTLHYQTDHTRRKSSWLQHKNQQIYNQQQSNLKHINYSNIGHKNLEYKEASIDKQNLFTKPEIMRMIKNDIKRIQQRKKSALNLISNQFQQNQKNNSQKGKSANGQRSAENTHNQQNISNNNTNTHNASNKGQNIYEKDSQNHKKSTRNKQTSHSIKQPLY